MHMFMPRKQLIEALQAIDSEYVTVQFMNDQSTRDFLATAPIDEPVECAIIDLCDGVVFCEVLID